MAAYYIKDLEKLSKIKCHTIRIWEQRYGLLKPKRTANNIRYYSEADAQLLVKVALLNKHGYKISHIAKLSPHELDTIAQNLAPYYQPANIDQAIDHLTQEMLTLNEQGCHQILDYYIQQVGLEQTILTVIFPFLDRLNDLWVDDEIKAYHEGFIKTLIRHKVIVALYQIRTEYLPNKPNVLLFLSPEEHHGLSLMFVHLLLKIRGYLVLNIGEEVHLSDLKAMKVLLQPSYVFTILDDSIPKRTVQQYIESLAANFPQSHVLLTGQLVQGSDIRPPSNVSLLGGLEALLQHFDESS